MLRIDLIVGVRPDFIQAASLVKTFSEYEHKLEVRIVHTGQHYDPELSQIFIEQLGLEPIHCFLALEAGEGTRQLAAIMTAYSDQVQIDPPMLTLVMGNSNSALGCALAAARSGIQVGHIDAGVRYEDRMAIEELNDMLIDQLSSVLFTSSGESAINLIREGFESHKIMEVGSLRSDAVFQNLGYAEDSNILDRYGLETGGYILVTLHHSYLTANAAFLISFFALLEDLSEQMKIHLILHPKLNILIEDLPEIMLESGENLQLASSHTYHDMLKLIKNCALVLTDSQGLQEESSILGVQCLTLGDITNRPITLSRGTNAVAGLDMGLLRTMIISVFQGETKDGYPIDLWDGKTGQRISQALTEMTI